VDLSIVIVNYNSGGHLRRCLAALEEATVPGPVEVVVVDNGSTDGSHLQAEEAGHALIAFEGNAGFARAANEGIAATRGDLILILNPDVVLPEKTLERLLRTMRSDPSVGILGPRIREIPGKECSTLRPYPSNGRLLREALFVDRLFPAERAEGGWLQGCCLLLRRATLDAIGRFDTGFFLYYEDVDLCYRLRGTSWRTAMEPACEAIHHAGERDARYGEAKLLWYHRSLVGFFRKHYPREALTTLRRILMLRSVLRLGVWAALYLVAPSRREMRGERLRGYAAVLRALWNGSENGVC
jgi:GT2 family glycosyltransferase